ncbi:uncharacterized protein RJT21DRAFT_57838 [Scheffersomyces amazonensis]|uniref:uncharacterized protein n=1 Tax=Scheffersomyces amazonensis TaxID=1078765 RepID=UPI00315CE453
MNVVVSNSSSLQNSFISTIDHLPCDVIRSLWLVQSCNIQINKRKMRLDQLLEQLQTIPIEAKDLQRTLVNHMIQLKFEINRFTVESISEIQALNNQLITHKIVLTDELQQLQQLYESRSNQIRDNHEDLENLRKQLDQHYRQHPLISQQEALKEQARLIKEAAKRKKTPSAPSGLKILLKIPSKIQKPTKPDNKRSNNVKTVKQKTHQKPVVIEEIAEELPLVEEEEEPQSYCFCKQGSFGEMIACDNEESCPNGEWFHYKCVGLLNRVDALKYSTGKLKWFCSDHCRQIVEAKDAVIAERKKKKKRRRW